MSYPIINTSLFNIYYREEKKRWNEKLCSGLLKFCRCRKKWGFKSLMRGVQWWQAGTCGQIINWALSDRCVKCNWHGPSAANTSKTSDPRDTDSNGAWLVTSCDTAKRRSLPQVACACRGVLFWFKESILFAITKMLPHGDSTSDPTATR